MKKRRTKRRIGSSDSIRSHRIRGAKNPNWKPDGTFINSDGYRIIRVPVDHPHGWDKRKIGFRYCYEHVDIMYRLLGRPLTKREEVHHKDENKSNNDPSNLELRIKGPHQAYHAKTRPRSGDGKFSEVKPPEEGDCYDWKV